MRYCFPIENFSIENLPQSGQAGSFWENRTDRRHCGIDIYAPFDTDVFAISDGIIENVGLFTTPTQRHYWNDTYYFLLKMPDDDLIIKYAELGEIFVANGDSVHKGQIIGKVGRVLNHQEVNEDDPNYIRNLVESENECMLHLELYKSPYSEPNNYSGGNVFSNEMPLSLLNINDFLRNNFK